MSKRCVFISPGMETEPKSLFQESKLSTCLQGCPGNPPLQLGLGFGLGVGLELSWGQFSSEAIVLEPFTSYSFAEKLFFTN